MPLAEVFRRLCCRCVWVVCVLWSCRACCACECVVGAEYIYSGDGQHQQCSAISSRSTLLWLCMRTCTHVQSSPQPRSPSHGCVGSWQCRSDRTAHSDIDQAKRYLEGGSRCAAVFEAWVQIRALLCAAEAHHVRDPRGVLLQNIWTKGACALSVLAALPLPNGMPHACHIRFPAHCRSVRVP